MKEYTLIRGFRWKGVKWEYDLYIGLLGENERYNRFNYQLLNLCI